MDCFRAIIFWWKHKMQLRDACLKTVSRSSKRIEISIQYFRIESRAPQAECPSDANRFQRSLVSKDQMKSAYGKC